MTIPDRPGPTVIDLKQQFRRGATTAGSDFLEVEGWSGMADHARSRGSQFAVSPSLAAEVPQLVDLLTDAGVTVVVPRGGDTAGQVADVAVGIVQGELAVAETGSVLVAELELADRVVSMFCRRLVQVVAADRLVGRLEDAAAWLERNRSNGPGFASLMTGPSRTADIERSLTIGVQGPENVDVVLMHPAPATGGEAS